METDGYKLSETDYYDHSFYLAIGKLGEAYKKMFDIFPDENFTGDYDALDYMRIGKLPVFFEGELIGFFVEENGIVWYYKAEKIKE